MGFAWQTGWTGWAILTMDTVRMTLVYDRQAKLVCTAIGHRADVAKITINEERGWPHRLPSIGESNEQVVA
jgi:hypothetical protein